VKTRLLLMRELVDNQLLDSQGERLTKVAGVEAELREGSRPVVRALLVGPEPLGRRIGPRIGRIAARIKRVKKEIRIPWQDIKDIGADIQLNVLAYRSDATRAEDWVREKIICKIPGSG
jgi:sporulation protein YlmC with PRC-barrel domain